MTPFCEFEEDRCDICGQHVAFGDRQPGVDRVKGCCWDCSKVVRAAARSKREREAVADARTFRAKAWDWMRSTRELLLLTEGYFYPPNDYRSRAL